MTAVATSTTAIIILADLLEQLGDIAPARVRFRPVPDTATEAVEVLSAGNTPVEMARKRQDYFAAGVQVVWQVDPHARTVQVFTAPEQSTVLHEAQTLEGDTVLPGFTLPLQELFSKLGRRGER